MYQTTYSVTLSCYRRVNGATRLTPTVQDRVEADSSQEAAYLIMEHWDYLYVDRVEVTLPDGAIWQRDQVLYKNTYSVAIWETGKPSELPIVDQWIQADSPLLAALKLMHRNELTHAVSVSVRCPDGSVWRKEHLKIKKNPLEQEGETL